MPRKPITSVKLEIVKSDLPVDKYHARLVRPSPYISILRRLNASPPLSAVKCERRGISSLIKAATKLGLVLHFAEHPDGTILTQIADTIEPDEVKLKVNGKVMNKANGSAALRANA
jgi:hypothetical protein